MNDDMPWIDLTPEEIQELRSKKQKLTEYGKQKLRELMNDGKLRFYDKGKETLVVEDSWGGGCKNPETQLHIKEMTHEEMLEEAERRENEQNEELEDAQNWIAQNFQEAARQELAKKSFEELTREERIKLALEEVDWIVLGGQDGEEFYNSIEFIRKVLRSLV